MARRASDTSGRALRLAAAGQAAEAVGLAVAAVFSAVSTADGKSYQVGSGIALTVIALAAAAALGALAVGLYRVRPWSRTPVVITQLFVIISGVTLLDGHRPDWGVPALALAAGLPGRPVHPGQPARPQPAVPTPSRSHPSRSHPSLHPSRSTPAVHPSQALVRRPPVRQGPARRPAARQGPAG